MAKLLPPILANNLPAFYNSGGTATIAVPFYMNRTVSQTQIDKIYLKLKSIQSSTYLFTLNTTNIDFQNSIANFIIPKDLIGKLRIGWLYKVQIAYSYNDDIGYYSNTAIIKYTTKPQVEIVGLDINNNNTRAYSYTGVYSQAGGDTKESLNKYRFMILNEENNIEFDTGFLQHDASEDSEIYESHDTFEFNKELINNKVYYIQYITESINGITVSSPQYRIVQSYSVDSDLKATLEVKAYEEDAYVDVVLKAALNENGQKENATGTFSLFRSSVDNDFKIWEKILDFNLYAQEPDLVLIKDFTLEHGKEYQYSIQQYNSVGVYSNRLLSNKIKIDFEYAYLYDGERQLKIKYNPKISTFKADISETKIETIGSQFPYILRNGNIYYHEFAISGLISYYMDENNKFITEEELNLEQKTTDLTSDNYALERLFKLEVLKWLNNGKPKLFRTPSEGNYIVRLMNITLTPNDTLGRLLHSFNCTAYEVAEFSFNLLSQYNFISNVVESASESTIRWSTIELYSQDSGYTTGLLNKHIAKSLQIKDARPGTIFQIAFDDNSPVQQIVIGITGNYYLNINKDIREISLLNNQITEGSLTYNYTAVKTSELDKIQGNIVQKILGAYYIGDTNIIDAIEKVENQFGELEKNPKIDILQFIYINLYQRPIIEVKKLQDKYYDQSGKEVLLEQLPIYAIGNWEEKKRYNSARNLIEFKADYYYDFSKDQQYDAIDFEYNINNNKAKLSQKNLQFKIKPEVGKLNSFQIGNGIIADVGYNQRVIEYIAENNLEFEVGKLKNEYNSALQALKTYQENVGKQTELISSKKEKQLRDNINNTYNSFINSLIKYRKEEKEKEEEI